MDTSILLDVFLADKRFAAESARLLKLGSDVDIAFLGGEKWRNYRKSGGKGKGIITDFLIGAHAAMNAERFLTRDRGFYKSYFPELQILTL